MEIGRKDAPKKPEIPLSIIIFSVRSEYFFLSNRSSSSVPTYSHAIGELEKVGFLDDEVFRRKIEFLNNRIEADHAK